MPAPVQAGLQPKESWSTPFPPAVRPVRRIKKQVAAKHLCCNVGGTARTAYSIVSLRTA
jgi:hypothetical protein